MRIFSRFSVGFGYIIPEIGIHLDKPSAGRTDEIKF